MPITHTPENRHRWECWNRNAVLFIKAGEIMHEGRCFKRCEVLAGSKARIIVAQINNYAYRHKMPARMARNFSIRRWPPWETSPIHPSARRPWCVT
jgi:hypothetical protein